MSSTELARTLGISNATLWRLKRLNPTEWPKSNDAVEAWRKYCLAMATDPALIARLLQ
jgi:hypothetical protein